MACLRSNVQGLLIVLATKHFGRIDLQMQPCLQVVRIRLF